MLSSLTRAKAPLYAMIADLLRQRIVRRRWPAGHRLPSLEELMAEFGVARVTVRQAMDTLAEEGLVTRQQGRGTFVAKPPADIRWLRVETSLEDLAAVYRDTQPELLTISESAAVPLVQPAEGRLAPAYRFMRRIHRRDGLAYCVINIYLDERIFRTNPVRFRNQTVIPLLLSEPGVQIARARQTLVIGTADMEMAGQLGVAVNAPVADVRRIFTDPEGTVIYLGDVTYRGDFI